MLMWIEAQALAQLKNELRELREYKEHHEFVATQLDEMLGFKVETLGDVVNELRRLRNEGSEG